MMMVKRRILFLHGFQNDNRLLDFIEETLPHDRD